MPTEMQSRAVDLAKHAVSQQISPREMAGYIKREFDRCYGPAWHCIVGKSFGAFVTHGIHKVRLLAVTECCMYRGAQLYLFLLGLDRHNALQNCLINLPLF